MLWSSAPIKADIFPNFLNVVFAVVWEPPAKREPVNAAQNRVFRILKTRFCAAFTGSRFAGGSQTTAKTTFKKFGKMSALIGALLHSIRFILAFS